MSTSQNGWYASPSLRRRTFTINGVEFLGGIVDNDDVASVLGHVLTEFDKRVEPLRNPGCWGFSYRANANNPNSLSNHSSATAVDANAPAHPNGVPTLRTFSAAQILKVHQILAEVNNVVRWGGDYTVTPDAMHFEINVSPSALAVVATRLRAPEDDMPYTKTELTKIVKDAAASAVDDLLSEKQANGKSLRENIRLGGNARDLAKAIANELGVNMKRS